MLIDGKWLDNVTCRKCRHRHPAELSCTEAAAHPDAARRKHEDHEAAEHSSANVWTCVADRLPPDETPVLIVWRGNVVIGERRWDHPGFEDTYSSYWYWDDPTDDGQDWGSEDVTHWMALPELPVAKTA